MTDLHATIERLRSKLERIAWQRSDSFKHAFVQAMDVIEALVSKLEAKDGALINIEREHHRQALQSYRKTYEAAIEIHQKHIVELLERNAYLLQAVFDGGVIAGELQGKLVDRERRLRACAKWVHGDQTQENYWRACSATNLTVPFKEEL